MRVVARGARHLAFAHGHVSHGPLGLGHLSAMTRRAELRLRRSDELMFGDFGLCTLWQVVQDRLRASCALPSHPA